MNKTKLDLSEYTVFDDDMDVSVAVCNNCGACADKPEDVTHHKTCVSGEAKKWEAYYNEANAEQDAFEKEYNADVTVRTSCFGCSKLKEVRDHTCHNNLSMPLGFTCDKIDGMLDPRTAHRGCGYEE